MTFSVRQYLEEKNQIRLPSQGKGECPKCGHPTLSVKEDTLAKCFYPECDFLITPDRIQSKNISILKQLMWAFAEKCHQFKLECLKDKNRLGGATIEYLLDRRQIHEEVVRNTITLGIVPYNFEWEAFKNSFRESLTEKKDLEAFNTDVERLSTCAHQGWMAFFYLDTHSQAASIKFRAPDTKAITWFTQGQSHSKGAFDTLLADPDLPPPSGVVALTEGEFNALQAQSLSKRNDVAYIAVYALGGVDTVDEAFIRELKGQLLHFEDHDDGGRRLTQKLTNIRKTRVVQFFLPDEDLDSYIRRQSDPVQAFLLLQKLIEKAPILYRNREVIEVEIQALRAKGDKSIPAALIPDEVGKHLSKEFQERGYFFKSKFAPYYLSLENHEVYTLSKLSRETAFLLHSFGLNPATNLHEYTLNELARAAFEKGKLVEIHWLWHYDKKKNVLYWYNSAKEVFKISEEDIQVFQNGIDGILFQPSEGYKPFNRLETPVEKDCFREYILGYVNLEEGGTGLDRQSSEILLRYWMLSFPFETLNPTRPLVTFLGEKGSGKTSLAKRFGQFVMGVDFQVSILPSKPEEFDVLVTNQPYVVLDNVDGGKPWLNDRLAQAATGGTVERRELYTTNRLIRYPIRSILTITTRTPEFRRDDVADRLLIFKLKRLSKNIAESQLNTQAQEGRDAFMSWYLLELQQVLRKLAQVPSMESSFRMADFASFCLRLAMADGENAKIEMEGIFARMAGVQTLFPKVENPLCKLLILFSQRFGGKLRSANEILEILQELSAEYAIPVPVGLKAPALGRRLSRGLPELKGIIQVDQDKRSSNKRFYSLTTIG